MDSSQDYAHAFVKIFDLPAYKTGILSSLTFAVKDLIDVAPYVTGCGNPKWETTHPPAVAHAICVEQLLSEGARCIGKTITGELAFGLLGESYFYGTPLNPQAPDRVPGGSSSGSASAVACGLVDFALGTDTGGSIRVPASNCGILGFRPSYGRISLAGVNPLATSFDTVGFMANHPSVLKKVSNVLLASASKPLRRASKLLILKEAFAMSDKEVQEALQEPLHTLSKRFDTSTITLHELFNQPLSFDTLFSTFCHLQWAEVWTTLGPWVETAHPPFGPITTNNFHLAHDCPRTDLADYIKKRVFIKEKLNTLLSNDTLLCIPTTSSLAPKKGSIGPNRTQGTYYPRLIALTALAGLASLPQLSLPLGSFEGVPVGLSLLAGFGQDEMLLHSAWESA